MRIIPISDPEFKSYGRVVEGYPVAGVLEALKTTPKPDGVSYVAKVDVLHAAKDADVLCEALYGGMPCELGYCNGHNTKLNCLEFHRDSEFNLGSDDFILLMAKLEDIAEDGTLDTAKVKAFLVPALHYAPCSADKEKGFRVLIALPDGTNDEYRPVNNANLLDSTLWARNKWLLAHPSTSEAAAGAKALLVGENLDIADDII